MGWQNFLGYMFLSLFTQRKVTLQRIALQKDKSNLGVRNVSFLEKFVRTYYMHDPLTTDTSNRLKFNSVEWCLQNIPVRKQNKNTIQVWPLPQMSTNKLLQTSIKNLSNIQD